MAAGNAVIGALRVLVGADTAELETGLKKSSKELEKFANSAREWGRVVAASMVVAATGLAVAMKGAINDADKLGKISQSIGIPVETLSELKYAADLSGVSLENLGKSVGFLSRSMTEALSDPVSQAAQTFNSLGIALKNADGSVRDTSAVMGDLAELFSRNGDNATKTALAIKIFGRAGADMIPLLNLGRQGLADMAKEARELGLIVGTDTSKRAEEFNDNLRKMQLGIQGVIMQVSARALPVLQNLAAQLLQAAKDSDTMRIATDTLVTALKGVATIAAVLTGAFAAAFQQLGGIISALTNLMKGELGKAFDVFLQGNVDVLKTIAGTVSIVQTLWTSLNDTIAKTGKGVKKSFFDPSILGSQKSAIDQLLGSTQKQIASMNAVGQTYGMTAGASAAFIKQMELEEVARQKFGAGWTAYKSQIVSIAQQYANASLQAEGFRLKMEMAGPIESMNSKLANLSDMLKRGAIDWETYGEAVRKTRAQTAQQMLGMASEAAGLFSQIFKDSKSAAIAQALISAGEGVARSLGAYPWPFAGIMAGLHAAAGAAQVARIRSVSSSGTGGTTAPAVTSAAAPAVNEQLITLKGMTPGSLFSRDTVIELVRQINDVTKDGAKLNIKVA